MASEANDSGGIPAGLTATLSIAWTGQSILNGTDFGLMPDDRAKLYFDSCYRCGLSFVFNNSFPLTPSYSANSIYSQPDTEYLGHAIYTPKPEIGECRIDAFTFLLDYEDRIPTRLLQIHFKPLDATENCSRQFLRAFAEYAGKFDKDPELASTRPADPALSLWHTISTKRRTGRNRNQAKPRKYALGHSYFFVFSLFNIAPDRFASRFHYAEDLYRLLFCHPGGVPVKTAEKHVKNKAWTSADFYEVWIQPGAMVVLSTAYPREYGDNINLYHASALNMPPAPNHDQDSFDKKIDGNIELHASHRLKDYDHLPEYPPFRYVTPLVALYGLLYEEILRDSYDRLLQLQKYKLPIPIINLWEHFLRYKEISRLTRRIARIDTLEHMRLPVSREIGSMIISSKMQNQVEKAIDQLRISGTNTALTTATLSLVGIFIATVTLVVRILVW